MQWISIYIGDDNGRPDRNGCTRDDFEQKWCLAFMNVGQELGVKIGRPLEQIAVRGYEDFYDKIEDDWKQQEKYLCKYSMRFEMDFENLLSRLELRYSLWWQWIVW